MKFTLIKDLLLIDNGSKYISLINKFLLGSDELCEKGVANPLGEFIKLVWVDPNDVVF